MNSVRVTEFLKHTAFQGLFFILLAIGTCCCDPGPKKLNQTRNIFSNPESGKLARIFSGRPESGKLARDFLDPPESAKPWVFWYWINACVSREGITADLEAMREAGIGGAYLMPIRGPQDPPQYEPPAVQLTPYWWELVLHAMKEADRLGLKIGMHACDGFAIAGGPWITPELSMQKVVWTETFVEGGRRLDLLLEQPETFEGYYRDIEVFAFPAPERSEMNSRVVIPEVSSSIPGVRPAFLTRPDGREVFRSDDSCWIQYSFPEPFPCRNITIRTTGYNYASHRLWIQYSHNGLDFETLSRLEPPRHGWQEEATEITYALEPTTARHFRFVYGKTGFEPGAEDLEMAKWTPSLRIAGIHLSASPKIHQYRGKSGVIWRIGPPSTEAQLPDSLCVPKEKIVNLTGNMNEEGLLSWDAPEGKWVVLRMGYTSTGKTNYTGGGGLGLECDKFNPAAALLQFESWFGAVIDKAGPELSEKVLEIFHVDSWECGSQNWSPVFREEFISRRGYDPVAFLPAMAGIPIESVEASENYLHDIRRTIAELVVDNFYDVLADSVRRHGCSFSAECIAPTMASDGMLHYGSVDLPMGEFWLGSPTHDKPNDILDAISGAHIYGKTIAGAEAFTEIRMNWSEHPGMLKALGDRNFALGINKLFYHVFAHNPWVDRRPGMTLSRIGLYFQRDQTWWKQSRAWVEYITRCQALLQKGIPVTDIAVFTGEEIPSRAVLPDRLVPDLPGIFGENVLEAEKIRLSNNGTPRQEMPDGVRHSANMTDAGDWIDALRGYKYDSFNPDVLLNLADVKDGRIRLPGGASYSLLVIPGARRMNPDGDILSEAIAEKILELAERGAIILLPDTLKLPSGKSLIEDLEIMPAGSGIAGTSYRAGKGRILLGPWESTSFKELGIEQDFIAFDKSGERARELAWTHRNFDGAEVYFISNQKDANREIILSLRANGRWPDLYNPLSGNIIAARSWKIEDDRTDIPLSLPPYGSLFIILERKTIKKEMNKGPNLPDPVHTTILEGPWEVNFDPSYGGPDSIVLMKELIGWHLHDNPDIRHYSGTAVYRQSFNWDGGLESLYWLGISGVYNIAEVYLNGESCGVIWTPPYRVEISEWLVPGENILEIHVSNTWANRLMGDQNLSPADRISWTLEPFRLGEKSLLEAGLTGKVLIYKE